MPPEAETEINTDSLDGLTAAEKDYFQSGGEHVDAVVAEIKADDAGAAAETAKVADDVAAKAADDAVKAEAAAAGKTEAEKAAAAKAAPGDDEDPADLIDVPDAKGGKPQKAIPYQKYKRELDKINKRAAEAEQRLAKRDEDFARADERLRMLAEALTPAQAEQAKTVAEEDPEPDPNTDIFAHNAWLRRELGRVQEAVTGVRSTVTETTQSNTMRENYQRDAVAFARETPDFGAAYTHLLTTRAAMLTELGYSEAQVRQHLHNEERGLVEQANRSGKRPAAVIYAMAKQLGYRPGTPAAAAATASAAAANGAAGNGAAANGGGNGHAEAGKANGTAAAEAKPSVTEEIERIQRGQEAGRTLSGGGGGMNDLTVESLVAMSDKEFAVVYAKNKEKIEGLLGSRAN